MGDQDNKQSSPPAATGFRSLFGFDRWRRRRVTIRIPVLLEFAENGELLKIPAQTLSVNDEEATLLVSRELTAGSRVDLQQEFTGERQSGRLIPASSKREDGFCIAVRFDSPKPGFWHISFPPPRF